LGIHLVDLLLWILDPVAVHRVSGRLFANGEQLPSAPVRVEDFAWAELQLDNGSVARLACSWNLSAGRDAVIEASFYGTAGAARLSNVDGSFYDFRADWLKRTASECIVQPPDDWAGRAIVSWARRLGSDNRFDPQADQFVAVAHVIDAIYGRTVEQEPVPYRLPQVAVELT
jgi:predicted dehydrogenase